jgi:hypothetical protein
VIVYRVSRRKGRGTSVQVQWTRVINSRKRVGRSQDLRLEVAICNALEVSQPAPPTVIARFGKPHQRIDAHGHEGKARRAVGRDSALLQQQPRTLF